MDPLNPILVLTTGGTIDKQYFDALSQYQITDSIITRLLDVARVRHPYQVEEVLRKDSIDITDADPCADRGARSICEPLQNRDHAWHRYDDRHRDRARRDS